MTVLYVGTYLDETDGLLEHTLHGVHLGMVELRKTWGGEATTELVSSVMTAVVHLPLWHSGP